MKKLIYVILAILLSATVAYAAGQTISGGRAASDSLTLISTTNATKGSVVLGTAEPVFINDTANAKSAAGLTINQAANDDEIISLKTSDVAHGMTTLTETDTFGTFKKYNGDNGGLTIQGYSDTGSTALWIAGVIGSTDPPDTIPAVVINGAKRDGGTSGNYLGDLETILYVNNNSVSKFGILGNGNLQIGGVVTPGTSLSGGAVWKAGTAATAVATDATMLWTADYLGTGGDNRLFIMGEGSASYKTVLGSGKVSQQGTTGGLTRQVVEATANITAAASITIAVNVPSGARLLGCQLRVDAALAAGETWDAAYAGGATQAIVSGAAVAKSTKVNAMFNTNAATDITSDTTTIAITKNGGGSFTAQGTIRAIVYFEAFDTMADAA